MIGDHQAYPLQWPDSWARTTIRRESRFGKMRTADNWKRMARVSLAEARDFVIAELGRLGATRVTISSNIPLRNDGLPRSGARKPDDTGVAVYWFRSGLPQVMACDTFYRVEDNLYAVGKSIEALRSLDRWGTSEIMERAFHGMALPAPGQSRHWADVLQVPPGASEEEIRAAYRARAKEAHPDSGGSDSEFAELQEALREALQ